METILVAETVRLTCEGYARLVEVIGAQEDPAAYITQLIRFVPQLQHEILRAYSFILEHVDGNSYYLAYQSCSI